MEVSEIGLLLPEQAKIADEFGRLEEELARYRRLQRRRDQIRDEILAWFPDQPAAESVRFETNAFAFEITPKAWERRIRNIRVLAKRLGTALFFRHCRIPLEVIDAHLLPEERAEHIVESQTGPRRIIAVGKLTI